MTREERVFIEFNDLTELEISCKHDSCKTRVTCSLHDGLSLPPVCPVCNKEWFSPGTGDPYKKELIDFSSALRALRTMQGGKRFALKLGLHEQRLP